MGRLGCGDNHAYVQERGGGSIIGELAYTGLSYGRTLDDMSRSFVSVGPEGWADGDCCDLLNTLEAWRHELSIYRDGVEVWVGPIVEASFAATSATISARDLFQIFERRILPVDRLFTQVPLGEIFGTIAFDALTTDPSVDITVAVASTAAVGDREYFAAQRRRCADELRELARSAVDFTMIRRVLKAGGEEIATSALPTLGGDTLLDVTANYRGLQMATDVTVIGRIAEAPEAPIVGHAGGVDDVYGLIEYTIREPSILDVISADAAAQTRHDLLRRPPLYLSGVLSEDAAVGFDELIPGATVDARLNVGCRMVSESMRLRSVDVSVSRSGGGYLEHVGVELVPLGSELAA